MLRVTNRLEECKGAEQHWMGVMLMTKEMMHALDKTGVHECVCFSWLQKG